MSVVIETTLGDITVDLFLEQRPITCLNFLKLCKMKYYNFNLFHSIRSGFIAQTGDPSGEGSGGESIWGLLNGPEKRFFSGEKMPKIRHTDAGLLSMVCTGEMMVGSQFFFTLGPDLDSLDGIHCVIGEVTEGHEILRKLNDVICDETHRPYQDVRITHTVVLEDPFSDPPGLRAPSRSPSPSAERLKGGRIAPDEELDEAQGKTAAEVQEMIEEKEAKARATILEIVGDLPDADIAPPENVLFVCKLNPVTTDEDLEIIFSRFGKIVSCEVIRDKKTGDSLQYAFIEFDDKKPCEDAYFKMDNVLIDDRRIHVDFSQSVSKMRWLGKGRGVQHFNDDGEKVLEGKRDRSRRSRSRDHNQGKQYSRDKYTDNRRNEVKADINVINRSHRERSRSRSKTEYQAKSRDYRESRETQNLRKSDEYAKKEKRRDRSSSKSKTNDKTDKSNDKKDRSRYRYEDNQYRSKHDYHNEEREDKSHHRNDLSESRKDNKSKSSRQQDEKRKEDRENKRDVARQSRNEDQQRSRDVPKTDLGEHNAGKDIHSSNRKYDGKHDSYKQGKMREETGDESRKRDDKKSTKLPESENEIIEREITSNSNKDNENTKIEDNHRHGSKHSRNEKEKNRYANISRNKYESQSPIKESTSHNEKISSRHTDKEVNRYEERYDKYNKDRNENMHEDGLQHRKNSRHNDNNERTDDNKRKKHHENHDIEKHQSSDIQEKKHRDRGGREKDSNQKERNKPAELKSQTIEKSSLERAEDNTQNNKKGKKKKGETKRKDVKKKIDDKKKSTNKKEIRKKKRKPSTSSDSESESSDSSSSTSSSSSSDSDHKRKKRKRKYSSSSSSDSSSSSSSSSSDSSTSSSDSDAKKRKIKKKRTNTKSKRK